ncbi:Glycosyl transferases group 1 [Brevibacterium siliguriense]|uniref:Glycosyl transferases group 1 n=1 Tax=Brevibacterium siliguriense TaxID=1136497 RepID=A0A1H1QJW3_9MICO|nr:glycosyltransferase [Brevibacterium siliguriense]SDS23686.1 Glycosyl transferases group 1 [Brevibacterium siliguriense]
MPEFGTDEVHVYNVLWWIPETMGGMTTAALRRIRSFQSFGKSLSQTILTFGPRMDTDEIRDRLVASGRMRDDVELVNIWQDLRGRSEHELAQLEGEQPRKPIPDTDGEIENITAFYDVVRNARSGTIIRRNYFRADGSLLVADIRDPKFGRRFILHSPNGTPMAEWRRPRDFYNAWIKAVVAKEPAVVIVDDKKVSEFIHEIEDRNFALVLFLHGTHLRHPWNGNHGQALPRRVDTVRNFDRFDVVGVQTRQQADAVRALGFTEDNIRLLTGELPAGSVLTEVPKERTMSQAVMIANLIELKRIDHPIRAVAKLRDRGVDVSLTVLGEGPERLKLEKLIDALDVRDRVELPGYVNDVSERLKSASFSMLTSTSEGLPLSMMESMGAGCIPIVYDITYGPRDLVEQGLNGFITPRNDVDALADQIAEFLSLSTESVSAMRNSAMHTAERYLPEAGYRRWTSVIERLPVAARLPDDRIDASGSPIAVKRATCEEFGEGCRIELEFAHLRRDVLESLEMVVAAREVNTFFVCGSTSIATRRMGRRQVVTFDVAFENFSESINQTFDVYLRRPRDLWASKRRIRLPRTHHAMRTGQWKWYSTKHGNLSVRPLR